MRPSPAHSFYGSQRGPNVGWTQGGSSLPPHSRQLPLLYQVAPCLLPVYPSQDSNRKLRTKGFLLSWEEEVRGRSSKGPSYMGSDSYLRTEAGQPNQYWAMFRG